MKAPRPPRIVDFDPTLEVPEFLVVPTVAAAEGREIFRRAEGCVERIVDAAEPEPLGDLGVELRVLAGLEAGDEAGSDAVRAGVAFRRSWIGEQAVEDLAAGLRVVVPARARRQVDSLAGGPGDLEERCRLLEVVAEIGVEQLVRRGAEGARGGDSAQSLEAHDRQALAVVPFTAAVEQAEDPVGVLVAAGEPQFLGQAGRGRRVDQGCVEGVDRRRKAERRTGDAGEKSGRVSHDEHVAVRGRRDRGEGVAVGQADLDLHVGEQELVRVGLLELREELALAEVHRRSGRRVGVGQDVEGVDAVPAVHRDFLEHHPRRDRHVLAGLEAHGPAGAGPLAGVHVLVDAQVRLHRVHETAEGRVVGGDPHRRGVADGNVDRDLRAAAVAAVAYRVEGELAEPFRDPDLRLVRDVADGARERPGAEQGALGPAQDFDPRHVEQVDVRHEERHRDDRLVEGDAHLLLDPGLVADDLSRGDAAHRDLALAGAEVLHGEPGHVGGDFLQVVRAAASQDICRRGDDGKWNLLEVLLALAGGHGEFLGEGLTGRLDFGCFCFLCRGRGAESAPEDGERKRQRGRQGGRSSHRSAVYGSQPVWLGCGRLLPGHGRRCGSSSLPHCSP